MKRMGNPAIDRGDHFTYGHYKTWPAAERWELIDGVAYSMSPAPMRRHQKMSHALAMLFGNFLKGKPCEVYEAPFDVLMPERDEADNEVATVVQPDLVVYCDRSKLTDRGARGSPDLVVEILSPSTSKKDLNEKFNLYERQGVREYWVIDPGNLTIHVWHMQSAARYDEGELREPLGEYGPIASRALEGFVVEPKDLFADMD
jgi:Uma2 family endonuclease